MRLKESLKINSILFLIVKCFKILFRIFSTYSPSNPEVQNPQRVAFIGITEKQ